MRSLISVIHVLGSVLALFAVLFLLPAGTALYYHEAAISAFLTGASLSLIVGLLIRAATQRFRAELKPRDGYLLVTLTWVALTAMATVPLLLLVPELSFTRAFFEAMSGLSTTGSTVLSGLDTLPRALVLWRHALSWLGGLGLIVMAVAILPLLGIGGMQMYRADAPGPIKDAKLAPRIMQTARLLWFVYVGLTAVCTLALRAAGMNWFDAVCHAFSVLSLGAFSTHDASIGYYHSPLIEMVLAVFMVIAAVNFATHFLALRKGEPGTYARDPEARWMLFWIVLSGVLVSINVSLSGTYPDFLSTARYVGFNLVSMATTCGLVSTDYGQWPVFAPMWMLFLSCLCASTGSTGGGIKMFRSLVLCKQSLREMFTLVHPQAVAPLKIAGQLVPNRVVYSVLAFIFLYFITIVVLTFALLISGLDFMSSVTAIIASINNVGPGLNLVGPGGNYGTLSDFQLWMCTAAMFLGRVEIFTVLILFTPAYWRK
ncbi:MAG TPA: potassium transporter TrkG [Steroidobacteraceae bacterium]|nr:potassium transporter TrkG [Steroidobacteraceae bacterium]